MAKEWIDVVDTAVKIGLGSLITGFFTYIGVKLSKKSEINKHFVEHKTKLLESALSDSNKYFSASRTFISCIVGAANDEKNDQTIEFPDSKKVLMIEKNNKLTASWEFYDSAILSLRILGAHNCVENIKKASDLMGEIRRPVIYENVLNTYDELYNMNVRYNSILKEFHRDVENFYASLHKL